MKEKECGCVRERDRLNHGQRMIEGERVCMRERRGDTGWMTVAQGSEEERK